MNTKHKHFSLLITKILGLGFIFILVACGSSPLVLPQDSQFTGQASQKIHPTQTVFTIQATRIVVLDPSISVIATPTPFKIVVSTAPKIINDSKAFLASQPPNVAGRIKLPVSVIPSPSATATPIPTATPTVTASVTPSPSSTVTSSPTHIPTASSTPTIRPTPKLYPTTSWLPPKTLSEDDMADWVLFMDEKANYSFKYPPEATVLSEVIMALNYKETRVIFKATDSPKTRIYIWVIDNQQNLNITEYLENIDSNSNNREDHKTNRELITINGLSGIWYKSSSSSELDITFVDEEKIYSIIVVNYLNYPSRYLINEANKDLAYQIINTFTILP